MEGLRPQSASRCEGGGGEREVCEGCAAGEGWAEWGVASARAAREFRGTSARVGLLRQPMLSGRIALFRMQPRAVTGS